MPKKTKNTQPAPEEEDEIKIINFDTFDLEGRFALKANPVDKEKTQLLCYPKYSYDGEPEGDYDTIMDSGEAPIVVTDEIVINKGGIPRYNTKYHESPESIKRAYFYIAEDPDCPGAVALFKWINDIDDYFDQKINKEGNADEVVCYTVKKKNSDKVMKRPFKGLTYKRMISETRKPTSIIEDEEEEDTPKKEYKPYKRIKVKFSTVWDPNLGPNDLKEIDTVLFAPGQDEPVDAIKLSDFDKHFTWKSTCKFGLMLNKFWIARDDERNCSFGLKCVQLAVTKARPEGQKKTAPSQLSRSLFTGKKFNRTSDEVDEADEEVNEVEDEVEDEVEEEDDDEFDEEEDDDVEEDEEVDEEEDDDVDEDEDVEEEDEDEDVDEDEEEDEDVDEDEEEDEDVEEEDEDEDVDEDEEEEPAPKRRAAKGKKPPAKKAPVKVKGKKSNSKVKGKKNRK